MLTPILLIVSFALTGLGLCFAIWERKELREDIEPSERKYWETGLDKYGPGVSLRSPPASLLTDRGKLYTKAKYLFLLSGCFCFIILVAYANI